jgi:hypothetical protein
VSDLHRSAQEPNVWRYAFASVFVSLHIAATFDPPTTGQMAYDYHLAGHQPPHESEIAPPTMLMHQVALVEEKSHTTTVTETAFLTAQEGRTRKKYYVPIELRTPFLLAFCIITLLVFTLLQVAAASYLGVSGLGSFLPTSNAVDKRTAHFQTTRSDNCPPGATCAPNPGSWSNPHPTEPIPVGAPPPGSWSTPGSNYFTGAYLPTLLAIMFSVVWKCIFARLKEMEPLYQMTKPGGAEAKNSLLLSYPSSMLPVVLLKSLWARHWLTLIGAVNLVLVTTCTLFAAETLFLTGVGDGCGVIVDAEGDFNHDCDIVLAMRPAIGFFLGVVLIAMVVMTLIATNTLRRCSSGVFAEATSIAGIASLGNEHLLQGASQSLSNPTRRYTLARAHDTGTVSIIDLAPTAPSHTLVISANNKRKRSHWEMRLPFLILLFLFQTGILVLILYYRFVSRPGTNNALETFMDSESFGVHFFMTLLGLGCKVYWGWIEKYMRRTSPYVALAAPEGATAERSVLLKSHSHPITALFSHGTWTHWLLGVVTLMAVLSEVLVITLNAIPFTIATAYSAYAISVALSTAILALMLMTLPAVMYWQMRNKGRVEGFEIPECMADVLEMTGEGRAWSSLSSLGERDRRKAVEGWGVRFAVREVGEGWQIVVSGSIGHA